MWFRSRFRSSGEASLRPRASGFKTLGLERLEDLCLPSFLDPVNYAVAANPRAALGGDFNTDGRPDLASVNSDIFNGDGTVSVLPGNADGAFQPARTSATGANPAYLAAGDFNADGRLDLVTAGNGEEICLLLGSGDATFQAPRRNFVAAYPSSVAVGDFNADGKLDLGVLSNWNGGYDFSGYAQVLLGTGTGAFSPPTMTYLGEGYHSSAAVADFNGDGKLDFAAANYYGQVNVALGDGTGYFGYPSFFGASPFYYDTGITLAAGDLNNDGRADLATANPYAGTVSVLPGNGAGSFGTAQSYPAGPNLGR